MISEVDLTFYLCSVFLSGLLLLCTGCTLSFFPSSSSEKSHPFLFFLCVFRAHLTINAFPFFLFAKFCCIKSCASLIYTCRKVYVVCVLQVYLPRAKSILCMHSPVYKRMNVKCLFVGVDSCINEQNNFLIEAKENEQWDSQSK